MITVKKAVEAYIRQNYGEDAELRWHLHYLEIVFSFENLEMYVNSNLNLFHIKHGTWFYFLIPYIRIVVYVEKDNSGYVPYNSWHLIKDRFVPTGVFFCCIEKATEESII